MFLFCIFGSGSGLIVCLGKEGGRVGFGFCKGGRSRSMISPSSNSEEESE